MPDAPIESLDELLGALTRERSLRGRLRVIGHAWSLLRTLSPAQREKVALRLGSKWAWKRVEKSFLEDGELSEDERLIAEAFERMGNAEPSELREIARTLKGGDGRAAKDLLVRTLTQTLEDEASDDAEQAAELESPESVGEAEPEPSERAGAAEPATRTETSTAPIDEVVRSAEELLASTLARPVDAPGDRDAPPPERVAPKPQLAATRARTARAEPPPPLVEARPLSLSEPPRLAATPETSAELPGAQRAGALGVGRLHILRALQRGELRAEDLGRGGRAELLDSLGGGWASRRALSRMIVDRSLDGVDEALNLIRRLGRPGQQTWCLADLLHHWNLSPAEVDRVLAAAPSDAARRRLAARSHAA